MQSRRNARIDKPPIPHQVLVDAGPQVFVRGICIPGDYSIAHRGDAMQETLLSPSPTALRRRKSKTHNAAAAKKCIAGRALGEVDH